MACARKLICIKNTILFICLLLFCSQTDSNASEAEFSSKFERVFQIHQSLISEDVSFSASNQIYHTYLTQQALKQKEFYIYDTYHTPAKEIILKHDEIKLLSKNISSSYENFGDIFITDRKIHTLTIPQEVEIGDTVSINYKIQHADLFHLPMITIPSDIHLEEYKITIKHPSDYSVDFELFFPTNSKKVETIYREKRQTTLVFKDIPFSGPRPYFAFNGVHCVLIMRILKNGLPVNPVDIRDFSYHYSNLFNINEKIEPWQLVDKSPDTQDPKISNPHLSEIKQKLKRGLDLSVTTRERIKIIYDFIRLHFRYIAKHEDHHDYIPHPPLESYSRMYGDCKDRAFLIKAIAAGYGIKIDLTLVSTEPVPTFKGTHINQFNHMICSHTDPEGRTIFFDPTAIHNEFGTLPVDLIGAEALILDMDNSRKEKILDTSSHPDFDIVIHTRRDDLKKGDATILMHNDFKSKIAYAIENKTETQIKNYLSDLLSSYLYKIILTQFNVSNISDSTFKISAKADLSRFIIDSRSKRYIPKTPFNVFDRHMLKRESDKSPLYLSNSLYLKLKINLPVARKSMDLNTFSIDAGDGTFFKSTAHATDQGGAAFFYEFKSTKGMIQSQEKNQHLEFVKKYLANKTNMFILGIK